VSQPLLSEKTAVVTGAAQGIGFAIAERFVAEGARVVIGDVDGDAAENAVKRLGGPDRARGVRCDVTDAGDMAALLAAAAETFSPVDVMVNNAGSPGTRPCAR
jgi:3-oxoacyl-[acyl-carrier protein] reductase